MTSSHGLLATLIVEDVEDDALLLVRELRQGGYEVEWERVETEDSLRSTLTCRKWDLVLSDHTLPTLSALQVLHVLRAAAPDLPCIVLSGQMGEETAVSVMRAGARDYLSKNALARLVPAVRRELREAQERRRADQERSELVREQAARQAAEAAVRARDEFLSIASHELRNPMAGILGQAQLLMRLRNRGQLDDEHLDRGLQTILVGGQRLVALMDDLLDVSRLRTGQLNLRPEPIDVVPLVRQVVTRYASQSDRHTIVLEASLETCTFPIDATRLEQVLTNLLSNAQKYSPAGGKVTVSLQREGEGVLLSVQDEGIGVTPDTIGRLFEPFSRASNATERNLPGMGLGLYICRQIVEGHGGRIQAESPGLDKGMTISLWLPLVSACPVPAEPAEATV